MHTHTQTRTPSTNNENEVHKAVFSPLCYFIFLPVNFWSIRKRKIISACWWHGLSLPPTKYRPLDEAAYLAHTKALQTWCHISQLEINVAFNSTKVALKTESVSFDGQHSENLYCTLVQFWTPRWASRKIQSIFSKDAHSDFISLKHSVASQQISELVHKIFCWVCFKFSPSCLVQSPKLYI